MAPANRGGMLARAEKKNMTFTSSLQICARPNFGHSQSGPSLSHKISYTGGTVDKRDFQGLSGLYRVLLCTEAWIKKER